MIVDALAAYRLVRLIRFDLITRPLRQELLLRVADGQLPLWTAQLIACPWCLSIWVAACIVIARRSRYWQPVARGLAVSAVVGLIAEYVALPDHDDG